MLGEPSLLLVLLGTIHNLWVGVLYHLNIFHDPPPPELQSMTDYKIVMRPTSMGIRNTRGGRQPSNFLLHFIEANRIELH